jgi:hypothetical protein
MTDKHPKRPRDPNHLAKSIIDIATGTGRNRPLADSKQGHPWILKLNLMVSANSKPTSEIVPAPFLPALLTFGHRCDGTGAVPGR